ncbi:M12 family metallopeptidase [Pyxidicoccus caerfyrddinensis]|uniref:M12 family metallopeptidase n=1 Tax=Pyxidicoccus caerfyrddinensis TaxID=2709663 RepID=UPI0013D961F4|nr:M12 family metallopeptidase [Pyxidicoccus caerfyrddinensis]
MNWTKETMNMGRHHRGARGALSLAGGFFLLALAGTGCGREVQDVPEGTPAEVARPPAEENEVRGSAFLPLGRSQTPQDVNYRVKDGWAVAFGDVLLGPVEQVEAESQRLREARPGARSGVSASSVGYHDDDNLWPGGEVTYTFAYDFPESRKADVWWAMAQWERYTVIRFKWQAECDFLGDCVVIKQPSDSGKCQSVVGRLSGRIIVSNPQPLYLGTECDRGRALHELGHAMGLYHEQSRQDRDQFIQVHPANFADCLDEFDKVQEEVNGPYDYGSIMHYKRLSESCSKEDPTTHNRLPLFTVTQTVPAGVVIGQRIELSDGDIGGLTSMYGSYVSRKYGFLGVATLGYPVGPEGAAKNHGRYRHYALGFIYFHPDAGAHIVRGEIATRYAQLGYENGALGYPVDDTETLPSGLMRNHFQGGTITWHPKAGYHVKYGSDIQLKGDFMGLGYDQMMYINPDGAGIKVKVVNYGALAMPGVSGYTEEWGQHPLLSGWIDEDDDQLVGDFMGLGYDQVLFINRSGESGRLMVLDFKSTQVPGLMRGYEAYSESTLLGGWLDDEDLRFVGDFANRGHDQVMFINREGQLGKLMLMDFKTPSAPGRFGSIAYREEWGQSQLLSGWMDANDLQLAGDFMGLGYDQLLFINRSGESGKVAVVDYSTGVLGGVARASETWTSASWLSGDWLDEDDLRLVGDFRGLGHDQVMFINRGGAGGKLMVLDYSLNVTPTQLGTAVYQEPWSTPGNLTYWLDQDDLQLAGDFGNKGHSQLLTINRTPAEGKVMLLDHGTGVVPGNVLYFELWGYFPLLDGFLD